MKREEGCKWIERKKMDREREGWIERKEINEERVRDEKKEERARKGGTRENLITFTNYGKVAHKCSWNGSSTSHKLTADRIIHSQSDDT